MGAAQGATFSTAPPDIVAQLNVNASESISLAQLDLWRRWVCVNRQHCISSERKGVSRANDLITNSPAHFVEPHTLGIAVEFCHTQLGYCMHQKQHCWDFISSIHLHCIYIQCLAVTVQVLTFQSTHVNSHHLACMFVIK